MTADPQKITIPRAALAGAIRALEAIAYENRESARETAYGDPMKAQREQWASQIEGWVKELERLSIDLCNHG
jgi:hypothetical protein